jgi:hypothetical protein
VGRSTNIQRPTCHAEQSETSLIFISALAEGIEPEILRFAQNDNED